MNIETLQHHIDNTIAEIGALAEHMPSIVIVHDLRTTSVLFMSENGRNILGVSMQELIAMGPEYHPKFFNEKFAEIYTPRILGLLERNNDDETLSYVQQVRAKPEEEWTWYMSCTKILLRDDQGAPVLIITNAVPMDTGHFIEPAKAERLLEENAFLKNNYHLFDSLTKREKEILRMTALGKSTSEIGEALFISEKTANTHRRNIKSKLKVQTNYDIVRFAQAFDLI